MSVEQIARRRVPSRGRSDLEQRVTVLEGEMAAMKLTVEDVKNDTSQILTILNAGKGIAAIIQKHGPRIIAFGTGIAVSAGFVDPKVGAFLRSFFGV